MSYRSGASASAASLDDEMDAPFAAATVPTYSTTKQANEQTTSYGGATDFHGRNGRTAKSSSTAYSHSDNVDHHAPSRASTHATAASQSYSSETSADVSGCSRCASKDAKLEKYKSERSLLKAEVKASHAREKNLQEQLDQVTQLQDELQKEVNVAQQSQRASKLEIDNLLSSHASTKKNYELRLKEASEKIEKLNSEKAAAKASSGWFGGSVLLGGGKSRADDSSSTGGESDKKVKKLESDLELFQSQIQTQMQSYQQLYEKHEQLKNEANNRAETLTHTIGESRAKAEKAESERNAMEKELSNARADAAEKERKLEAKLAELQSQFHSTLHSSSKSDQEWLQEKAVYEGILTELSYVWRSKIGFDDEQQASRSSTSLSLTLLPDRPNRLNMSCVLHSFNRVRYEIQREAVTSTQDQVWKLLSHTMNKTLLKHWKEKWSLQQSAPTAVAGVNPLSHVQGQPSSSHFTSLSKLSDTFVEKMTILQTNCKEVAGALDTLAGLKPAQDEKLSLLQSSALPVLTDLLKSPSALLEPLFAVLHCLASLAGLHAAVLEAGLSSHNFSAASNPAAYAAAAGMKNHVHTLAQGWSNLQGHLTRGAAALKKWCELNPNTSAQGVVSCPPFVHVDEPSTAVFVLPAAWPLEWIHTPAAAEGSTQSAVASPNPIAADVLAWFQTLHSLLTDVSSRFAVVSLHEQRTAATAAANAAAAHQSLDSGLDPTIHDPSVAAAAAAAESPAAVAIRSKLTEQNNLLLMGLNSLPKLAGSVVEVLKKGYERVQQLRMKQIQAEQFRENAWSASSNNDGANINSSSKPGLQVNSLPFASYLPSLSKLQPAALQGAQASTPPPVQTLVHLHKRCTNFLSTLNASTVSSHTVNGLAYSFALQQQSDLAQLNAQFDILSERYRELQTEHEHLETLQRMLTNEQQLLLEKYEKTHDTFAETQLDYFEEKKHREQINKQLASTIKQLEEKSAELASHQALVDSNRVMIQRLEKQLSRAKMQLDPNADVDNDLDEDGDQKTVKLNESDAVHSRLSDELRQSTLDFESSSTSFANVPTPMSIEEMVAAQQNQGFNYANLPDSTLRLNAAPSLTDSANTSLIVTDASVSEEEESFFLQSLRHGESSTTRASQWLEQAKQFQSMLQQQQQQQARNGNLVTPHKASSYSISFAANGAVGTASAVSDPSAALQSVGEEDTVSALPMSSALVTPLTNRTVARRRTLGGASGLFSPPFLSHVSPDRFAPSPQMSNESSEERLGSLEQLNSWTLHQQQARHHASQLLLTQTARQLDQLARSNAYLRHQQAQLAVVLNLLRTRSKEASQTAAATLSRLQEVQLERSESAQSYEAMMDELTERIFQLTQQLAEKDARTS